MILSTKISQIILLVLIFNINFLYSQKAYTEVMKLEIQKMYDEDQRLQVYDLKKVYRKEYSDSIYNLFNIKCRENTLVIKKYFEEYGYPGIRKNGKHISLLFWLLVQHSDEDVPFQKKVLKSMAALLKKKDVRTIDYAFLYDRVQKNENKPQLYGTQMIWDNNAVHSPYNLMKPKTVNKRRKKMGLEPMEEYLKSFNH